MLQSQVIDYKRFILVAFYLHNDTGGIPNIILHIAKQFHMNRFVTLLLLIVFISSTEILAEHHGLLPTDTSSQLSRVVVEQRISQTVSEAAFLTNGGTPRCTSSHRMERGCTALFRDESNNQLLQPLSLLLMALGLIGLALVTRIK